jgi:hypothetical protein
MKIDTLAGPVSRQPWTVIDAASGQCVPGVVSVDPETKRIERGVLMRRAPFDSGPVAGGQWIKVGPKARIFVGDPRAAVEVRIAVTIATFLVADPKRQTIVFK